MVQQAALGGASAASSDYRGPSMGIGGEGGGRRGGLGVWFQTKVEGSAKGDETDFVMITPLEQPAVLPSDGSLRSSLSRLVYSTPTDTLNDITEEKKGFPIRHGLIRKYGRVRMLTTYRDAHIYFFPHWVLDMIQNNETMNSISEDVVGWWAKAGWQEGLGDKLGLRDVLGRPQESRGVVIGHRNDPAEAEMDIGSLSSTRTSNLKNDLKKDSGAILASRMSTPSLSEKEIKSTAKRELMIPPMLAYIQPSTTDAPLIRRVDTAALLLSVSLKLAKLEAIEEVGKAASSPFAHQQKIAYPEGVASQRCTITKTDSLLAENVTVEEKSVVKESVVGANCHIKAGARLVRCVLMDGAVVGERCQLTGCILGRRCQIDRESVLKDCEVQDDIKIEAETDAKGEKFMKSDGLYDADNGDLDDNNGRDQGEGLAAISDQVSAAGT